MPFPSLRRRTVNEAVQLPEEHKSPSPSPRARSATVPGLTPRKSLISLIGSVRKRGNTSPSSIKPQHNILEQELYSVYDASSPDHDPCRASRSPSTSEKSKRYYRTPSPHPLKMSAVSSLSRLSKLSRGTPSSKCSDSSEAESPPKTFLETLADAIRAPTSLFYKENKINSKTEDATTSTSKPPSPGKSVSPKKSVRFKPGKSIIEDEPRSSPIDIPRPTPSLPPVQLASTPLLQYFGNDHPHLIPTGRPPHPRVLNSTINFRQAMAAAQTSITEDELQEVSSVDISVSERPLPLPGAAAVVENPVRGSNDVCNMQISRTMLQEYDSQFPSKGTEPCQSADIVIDKGFVANDESVQDLPGGSSTAATGAISSLCLIPKAGKHDGSLSEPKLSSEISPSELFSGAPNTLKEDTSELGFNASAAAQEDADSECSDGQSVVLTVSSLRRAEDDEKWAGNPTHEDIRGRFKHPECYESVKPCDTGIISDSNVNSQGVRTKAPVTPPPDSAAEWSPIYPPPSAAAEKVSSESWKRKKYQHSTADEDPYLYVPETFLHNPPWVAELALRCERPFPENKPRQLSPFFPRPRTERYERSTSLAVTMTESEPDGGALLYPEDGEIQTEGSTDNLGSLEAESSFWPTVPCARDTPSPACIPLPLSIRPSARASHGPHTDEYESCPFEDDRELSNVGDGHVEPCAFNYSAKTDKSQLDQSNCADPGSASPHIPRDTEEEKLARAAEVLRRFIPRKASGSSSSNNPTTDPESKSAREYMTRIPRLKRGGSRSSEAGEETLSQRRLDRGRSTTMESRWSAGSETSRDSGSGETLKTTTSTDHTEGMDEDERLCKGIV